MPIFPLPQFEADVAEYRIEKEAYERLSVPKTVVVRFGSMKMIGEFPFDLNVKPGCGTKMVARTHRGTELAEMLTSTCPNAGCSKSVTRKEMLQYIENSGGKDYPYFNEGKILRIATTDDLNEQRRIEGLRNGMKRFAQQAVEQVGLPMKVVDAEPILGGERLTFFFTSEDRVDFRDLVAVLSKEFSTRIDLRQVGARDEARLIADYEKCGQHCCCKQFLKVLKPISMKAAKTQKATLDPLKISGRCGRLMCCLRYEDETYETLRKKLPRMKSRVMTPDGPGMVIDTQILTQLVLVILDADDKRVAVPVESLSPIDSKPMPKPGAAPADAESGGDEGDPLRGMNADEVARKVGGGPGPDAGPSPVPAPRDERQQQYKQRSQGEGGARPAAGGRDGPRRDEPRRDEPRRDEPRRDGGPRGGERPPGGDARRERGGPSSDRGGAGRGNGRAGGGRGDQAGRGDGRRAPDGIAGSPGREGARDAGRDGGRPSRGPEQGPGRPPRELGPAGDAPTASDDAADGDEDGPDDDGPDQGPAQGGGPGVPGGPGQPGGTGGAKKRRRRRRRGGGGGRGGPQGGAGGAGGGGGTGGGGGPPAG